MPTTSNDQARCVVLTPPDAAMSDSLRDLLVERSWRCVAIDDPLLAMAELCLEDRARSTRRMWSPEPEQNIALVLDVPVGQDESTGPCHDLLDAVTRYLPGASIWAHRGGELSALRAGEAENGDGPARPAAEPANGPEACEITPEEIEMLLGTGDEHDAGG